MHNVDIAKPFKIPPSPALEEMMRQEVERGVDPLYDPPPPPGPAEVAQPLVRPGLPPPDWRAEAEELAQREAEPEASAEPSAEGELEAKPTSTPNLDLVRSWGQP